MSSEVAFHAKMSELADFTSDDKIYLSHETLQVKGFCHDIANTFGISLLPCITDEAGPQHTMQEIAEATLRLLQPHMHQAKAEDQQGLANLRRFFVKKMSPNPVVQDTITVINSCLEKTNPFKKLPSDLIKYLALVDGSNEIFNKLRLVSSATMRSLELTILKDSALLQSSLNGHARSIAGFARLLVTCLACGKQGDAKVLFDHFNAHANDLAKDEFMRLLIKHRWFSRLLPLIQTQIAKSPTLKLHCQHTQFPLEALGAILSNNRHLTSLKISDLVLRVGDMIHLQGIGCMEQLTSLDIGSVYSLDFAQLGDSLNLNGLTTLSCGLRFGPNIAQLPQVAPILSPTQQRLLSHFSDFYSQKLVTSDLSHLEQFSLYAPHECLALSAMPWETMRALKHLTLHRFLITEGVLFSLRDLPLESLCVNGTFVGNAAAHLSRLVTLKKLQITTSTPLNEITESLEHLRNLESLTINSYTGYITDLGQHLRTILEKCPKLKELSLPLFRNISTSHQAAICTRFENHKALESLSLFNSTPLRKELLSAILKVPTLKKLSLNNIDFQFKEALRELRVRPNIQELSLLNATVEGAVGQTAALVRLPSLKHLTLCFSLGDRDAECLAALTELETLIIPSRYRSNAKITDKGLRKLATLPKLSHLQMTGHDLSLHQALAILRHNKQIKKFSCAYQQATAPSFFQWLLPHLKTPEHATDPLELELLQHTKVV